jgi:putative ABC transport system permease protein
VIAQGLRVPASTVINIVGLAIGLCAALFIALMIRTETRYDRFIPDHERVFRVSSTIQPPGQRMSATDTTAPDVAQWLRLEFKSIEHVARISTSQNGIRHGEVEANETVYWAEPDFLRVMTFPAVAGDVATALDRPDSVVLTRTLARRYFGRDDPVGEPIEIDRQFTMKVAAVIEDMPDTSHLNIEMLASGRAAFSRFVAIDANRSPTRALSVYTYLKLRPGVSAQSVQDALPALLARRSPGQGRESNSKLLMLPVTDIHLHAPGTGGMKPNGSVTLLVAVGSIGVLIVLIAVINYVNLMTARGAHRAVEVGVRKSFGARRRELVRQFMAESVIYVSIAAALAVLLFMIFRPKLNGLLEAQIPASFWRDPVVAVACVGATLLIGGLAAVYPAFVLSSFRPGVVLRGGPAGGGGSGVVREVLIASQLAVLIGLIVVTSFVYRQGQYALNDGLRFDTDMVLVIQTPITKPCAASLRDEIRALPGVRTAACSLMAPFANGISDVSRTVLSGAPFMLHQAHIDFDFFELYGIETVAGRVFSRSRAAADSAPTDPDSAREAPLVLNETAVRRFGFKSNEDAIGKTIDWARLTTVEGGFTRPRPAEIIGVVRDFPMGTIRKEVEPTVYAVNPNLGGMVHVKLDASQDVGRTLEQIDALWKRLGDARPITRRFADETIERRYLSVTRQMQVLAAFSVVALFIACLGLLGLSAFATERRTREVGIRKALGASRADIVRYFLWQFTKPVIWASIVALPAAYILARRWLEGFAYRVDLDLRIFFGAAVLTWLIASATVLVHVLRAARARPVEALRYE